MVVNIISPKKLSVERRRKLDLKVSTERMTDPSRIKNKPEGCEPLLIITSCGRYLQGIKSFYGEKLHPGFAEDENMIDEVIRKSFE